MRRRVPGSAWRSRRRRRRGGRRRTRRPRRRCTVAGIGAEAAALGGDRRARAGEVEHGGEVDVDAVAEQRARRCRRPCSSGELRCPVGPSARAEAVGGPGCVARLRPPGRPSPRAADRARRPLDRLQVGDGPRRRRAAREVVGEEDHAGEPPEATGARGRRGHGRRRSRRSGADRPAVGTVRPAIGSASGGGTGLVTTAAGEEDDGDGDRDEQRDAAGAPAPAPDQRLASALLRSSPVPPSAERSRQPRSAAVGDT